MPEAIETAVVEAIVKADPMKCTNMGTTKVATTETAAVAATTVREGRRWCRE